MDFEFENGEKLKKTLEKNMFYFNMVFSSIFGTILEGFGIPNGGQDGPKMGKLGVKKAT